MTLQQTYALIDDYLSSGLAPAHFGPKYDVFLFVVPRLKEIVASLEKDEKPDIKEETLNAIGFSVELTKEVVVNRPVSEKLKDFIAAYCLLLKNINDQTIKHPALQADAELINNYINLHFTAAQLIHRAERLLERFEQMSRYTFPTVELSKHYLASLQRKLQQEEAQKTPAKEAPKTKTEERPAQQSASLDIPEGFEFEQCARL